MENLIYNKNFIVSIAIVILIFGIFIWTLIGKIIKYKEIQVNRNDAVKRSKNVILWELYEKIIPFLPNFKYSPKDMVFIWKWFDYLVLDWLSSWDLNEIIFLEIKSWTSSLNKNERMIRNTINAKKIKYEEYKINT